MHTHTEALKSASQPNHTDAPDGGGPEVGVAELRNVMCVADLRKLLSDAEAEKERALEQVKAAEKKIKLLKEKVWLTCRRRVCAFFGLSVIRVDCGGPPASSLATVL